MDRPTAQINFTNGFGNNLFQYIFGRLLAMRHKCNLSCNFPSEDYYGKEALIALGITPEQHPINENFPTINVNEPINNRYDFYLWENYENNNFILNEYFEDFRLYDLNIGMRSKIKSWFVKQPVTNTSDLVFHLRLGDRLIMKSQYEPGMFLKPEEYIKAISKFKFDKLYIVTDLKEWKPVTEKDIKDMTFHRTVPPHEWVDPKVAADYLNDLISALSVFNPIIVNGGTAGVAEDFNFIRSFDNIMFQHSTFSWWAATLSDASKVGVYKPWRPAKGSGNKNLGRTDYSGWFGWGGDEK